MLWKIWGDVCDLSQRLRTHRVVHHSWWRREEYLLQPNQPRMLNERDSKKDTPTEQMDICEDAKTCFAMSSYSIRFCDEDWTTHRAPSSQLRSDDKDWFSSRIHFQKSCDPVDWVCPARKTNFSRSFVKSKVNFGFKWKVATFLSAQSGLNISICSCSTQSKLWIICLEPNHLFIQFIAN